MSRAASILPCTLLSVGSALAAASSASDFSLAVVERVAAEMASQPHEPPRKVAPEFLELNYDLYRLIAPRHENAMWRDEELDTWAEFFPAGFLFEYPVKINVVDGGDVHPVEYDDRWFQFRGQTKPLATQDGGGFAGFRLLTQLPGNEHKTEYISFLGASYFRGIGAGDWYGTSARGLALDVGLPRPEEFPRFLEFWIERPDEPSRNDSRDHDTQRVWALMESPGVVGAYEFVIHPGDDTKVGVQARLWRRHGIQKLALAPLTSMWMWDAKSQPKGDPRPSVHDADGLLIHMANDEWVWRGLTRPATPRTERWEAPAMRGFGLMQRDRDPASYQDDEAHYHQRPSVWVQPDADKPWGSGWIELLELPAEHEGVDNIGAYFVLDQTSLSPDEPLAFGYDLTFGDQLPPGHQVATVADARVAKPEGLVVVQFRLPPSSAAQQQPTLTPQATCSEGEISSVSMARTNGRTVDVSLEYRPSQDKEARIEVWLEQQPKKTSEVWSYRWIPQSTPPSVVNQ